MGAVVGTVLATAGALIADAAISAAAATAAAAAAAGASLLGAAEGLGFISIVETLGPVAVYLTEGTSGVAFVYTAGGLSAASYFGLGPAAFLTSTITITPLGVGVIGAVASASVLGVSYAVVNSALGSSKHPSVGPSGSAVISGQKLCSIWDYVDGRVQCGVSGKRKVRVETGTQGYRTMPPVAEEDLLQDGYGEYVRSPQLRSSKSRKVAQQRKRLR